MANTASDMFALLQVVLIMSAFYSIGITTMVSTLPEDARREAATYTLGENFNVERMNEDMSSALQSQTSIPLIEMGALVFYSGNFIIDFMMNFITAIPQMLSLLLLTFTRLFPALDIEIIHMIQIFTSVVVSAMYVFGLIGTLLSMRSGTQVV